MANDQLSLDHVAREILIRSGTGQVTRVITSDTKTLNARELTEPSEVS